MDVIVLLDVIEHLPSPAETLALCVRHLNPGGILVITTGDFGAITARLAGAHWRLMTPPQHLWFFSRDSIRRMAAALGLALEHLRPSLEARSAVPNRLPAPTDGRPAARPRDRAWKCRTAGQPVRRHAGGAAQAHAMSDGFSPQIACLACHGGAAILSTPTAPSACAGLYATLTRLRVLIVSFTPASRVYPFVMRSVCADAGARRRIIFAEPTPASALVCIGAVLVLDCSFRCR